jgi:DNA-directed RNA polymerase sigma subunit (sigma70/sigma32)
MAKTQSRETSSRSARATTREKSARHSSTKTAKVAAVKKSSSAPVRSLDQPVKHRADSKQARVIEMLMRHEGATIDDIVKATDWQPHSVRGFFAGIIRKKLKLTLTSEAAEAGRIYKVAASAGSKPAKAAA